MLMLWCAVCRLKLETLTDKDPGELKIDAEEEQKDKQCQDEAPHPVTDHILLDEEDLIIDQYDSE